MKYFIITLLLFASMEVASKPLMAFIDPYTLTLYRFFIGFSVLTGFAIFSKRLKEIILLSKKQIGYLFLLGFINVFFSMSMLQIAIKETNAATAAVVFCSNPIFVLLFSLMLGDEKFSIGRIAAFLLGIIGVVFIMKDKGLQIDTGAIYAVVAAISFAAYSVLAKKTVKGVTPLITNVVSFFFGVVALFVFLLITGKNIAFPVLAFENTQNILLLAYIGIGISGIGYITFMLMLKQLSASSASVVFLIKPIIATILAVFFLKEHLSTPFFIGLFCVVVGSVLIFRQMNAAKK